DSSIAPSRSFVFGRKWSVTQAMSQPVASMCRQRSRTPDHVWLPMLVKMPKRMSKFSFEVTVGRSLRARSRDAGHDLLGEQREVILARDEAGARCLRQYDDPRDLGHGHHLPNALSHFLGRSGQRHQIDEMIGDEAPMLGAGGHVLKRVVFLP